MFGNLHEIAKPLYTVIYLLLAGIVVLFVAFIILRSLFLAMGVKKQKASYFARQLAILIFMAFIGLGYIYKLQSF